MRQSEYKIEGLSEDDIRRIKSHLDSAALERYVRLTKSVALIEAFKPQIAALRRAGFPWAEISIKLERLTGRKISPATIKTHVTKTSSTRKANTSASNFKKVERSKGPMLEEPWQNKNQAFSNLEENGDPV